MGYTEDNHSWHLRNPANKEILSAFEHNDIWGAESRIFALCYQNVRDKVGPYKIFGSQENT